MLKFPECRIRWVNPAFRDRDWRSECAKTHATPERG